MNRGTSHRSREGIVSLIRSHLLQMLDKLQIKKDMYEWKNPIKSGI